MSGEIRQWSPVTDIDRRSALASGSATPKRKYVVVTGPIAAGASTLSEQLIIRLGWHGHLEGNVELDNAFFQDAYSDFARWGFANQVHFLLASVRRHKALRNLLIDPEPSLPSVVVEDRTPYEHTDAYLTSYETLSRISDREAALLRELTSVLERDYLVPDLLIYRRMSHDQLLNRVQQRNRPGEDAADLDLLETLRQSFDEFIGAWDRSPKLVLAPSVDVLNAETMNALVTQIVNALDGTS